MLSKLANTTAYAGISGSACAKLPHEFGGVPMRRMTVSP